MSSAAGGLRCLEEILTGPVEIWQFFPKAEFIHCCRNFTEVIHYLWNVEYMQKVVQHFWANNKLEVKKKINSIKILKNDNLNQNFSTHKGYFSIFLC